MFFFGVIHAERVSLILPKHLSVQPEAAARAMQFTDDSTPPGPQIYREGHTVAPRAYESPCHCSELEHILDGMSLLEREAVRTRNGLDADGPWHDLWVVSSEDIDADIADFDAMLRALVEFEDPSGPGGVSAPRMHYIRELIHECLYPLCIQPPEVLDVSTGAFYDAAQRAHLMTRITCLLGALQACQTLHMHSDELRMYSTETHKTPEQIDRAHFFIQLAQCYNAEFTVS